METSMTKFAVCLYLHCFHFRVKIDKNVNVHHRLFLIIKPLLKKKRFAVSGLGVLKSDEQVVKLIRLRLNLTMTIYFSS